LAAAEAAAKMAKSSATPRQRNVEAGEASVRRCEEAGEITAWTQWEPTEWAKKQVVPHMII
jgi:hypothetical protein